MFSFRIKPGKLLTRDKKEKEKHNIDIFRNHIVKIRTVFIRLT
jgi:hypothetical protein